MSRRVWTGVLAGLLAAVALIGVAGGAYHAGERRTVAVTTVAGAPGTPVQVIGDGPWQRGGPPFGFLFPRLIIGLVVLAVSGRRRHWGHHGPGGWGPGSWGPGGWGGSGGPGGWDRDAMLGDWHRRAHGGADLPGTPAAPDAPAAPTGGDAPITPGGA